MTRNQIKGSLILVFILLLILIYLKFSSSHPKPISLHSDTLLDLNQVDSLALLKLPGIGEQRAHAILQYRRMWNGFRSPSELSHIAALPPRLSDTLQSRFIVQDTTSFQKMQLNSKCYRILVNSALFSKREAYLIQKYLYTPDSLQKYLSSQSLKKLYHYFKIPARNDLNQTEKTHYPKKYELNKVTEEELQSVTCLPSWLKKRFLRYRKRLGYFVSEKQLEDLYGIQPEHLKCFHAHFYLDKTYLDSLPKISINQTDVSNLLRLPYLTKELAYRIIKYREKIGVYDSLPELLRIYGMDSVTYQKIMPYLSL